MSLSSLFVVTNALRLRRFKPALSLTSKKDEEDCGFTPDVVRIENGTTKQTHAVERNECEDQIMDHFERELTVEGMMCKHCARHVTEALQRLGLEADVDLEAGKVKVRAEKPVTEEQMRRAIEEAGYRLSAIEKLPL